MSEAEICAAAVAMLRSDGWEMSCEVPFLFRNIDAAGVKEGQTIAVEAKKGCCPKLEKQLTDCYTGADFLLAVVGVRPRLTTLMRYSLLGAGVWLVTESGVEVLAPIVGRLHDAPWAPNTKLLMERIRLCRDDAVGGVPNLPGIGVAQDVQRAVDEYRGKHPKATWKEIHASVPSHYKTASNMYSALRSNAIRLEIRARNKRKATP